MTNVELSGGWGMNSQDQDYGSQIASVAWWLRLADYSDERDARFADLLRMRAREIQKAEDQKAKTLHQHLPV